MHPRARLWPDHGVAWPGQTRTKPSLRLHCSRGDALASLPFRPPHHLHGATTTRAQRATPPCVRTARRLVGSCEAHGQPRESMPTQGRGLPESRRPDDRPQRGPVALPVLAGGGTAGHNTRAVRRGCFLRCRHGKGRCAAQRETRKHVGVGAVPANNTVAPRTLTRPRSLARRRGWRAPVPRAGLPRRLGHFSARWLCAVIRCGRRARWP